MEEGGGGGGCLGAVKTEPVTGGVRENEGETDDLPRALRAVGRAPPVEAEGGVEAREQVLGHVPAALAPNRPEPSPEDLRAAGGGRGEGQRLVTGCKREGGGLRNRGGHRGG